MRIAFIGGGNMASALIGGLVAQGRAPASLAIVEPLDAQRARLAQRFAGVDVHGDVASARLRGCSLVVLSVKPQHMREACAALATDVDGVGAVLSVAAGMRIGDLSRWLGGYRRIVRAMPNTPALIGAGISGAFAPPAVSAADRETAEQVLSAAGQVLWCENEAMLDAVTGVSASGPAYVFYCIEALEEAARELGFAAGDARRLAYATFDGAVRLACASDTDVQSLRAQVTSKGGTTERGVAALEQGRVRQAIVSAAKAATARATEMGDEFGNDATSPGAAA